MFPLNVLIVVGIEFSQIFDTIHKLGHTSGDVVVAVETDRTVRDCFRAGILVRQETGNLSMMIRTFVCLVC